MTPLPILPVSLIMARAEDAAVDTRYHWDSRKRGENAFLIFQYTRSGQGIFHDGQQEIAVPPGHALFTTTVEASAYYYPPNATEPWKFSWMDISGMEASWKWLREHFGSVIALAETGMAMTIFQEIATRYERHEFRDRFHSSELVFQFLMAVFRELTASSHRKDSAIHYARQYIEDNHQRPIGVPEIAAQAGLTREHFSRSFTTVVGQSPGAYLRQRRLATAALLLTRTSENIGNVARLSGFASASHFCRAFRLQENCTPEKYRQRSAGK